MSETIDEKSDGTVSQLQSGMVVPQLPPLAMQAERLIATGLLDAEGGELTTDPTGSLLTVACAAGESCSVPLDEVTAPENGVTSYYMAEVEGTVQVSHVYATGG